MAILDVQHIEKHFGDTPVLKDISFSLEEGQALSIIGSSGSGKTTLLRCLNFLETPDSGSVTLCGAKNPSFSSRAAVRLRRHKLSYLFQNYGLVTPTPWKPT